MTELTDTPRNGEGTPTWSGADMSHETATEDVNFHAHHSRDVAPVVRAFSGKAKMFCQTDSVYYP